MENYSIKEKLKRGLEVNDCFTIKRTFDEKDMIAFGNISRDYNPVHYNEKFAKKKNFKDRICHGLLVGSMVTEIGGELGWLATEMNFEFLKPVYFGDTITCIFTIEDIDDSRRSRAKVVFRNQRDEIVLKCYLKGIVPNDTEIDLMT
ncbi:MaoC family dehydratase [Natranaerofaba carboxydovora]|uniref:MaoC family dehydratase n=1 Tax=Natranaerofaba carboxydovora TaxID=2742683 RepID=UPI001F13F754|nr:MaoC family dehydratase [Natranaerofaba carboxydovora]UMZ73467.1 (R)-specific enoyl-CoA hydratase [Natranaerofaba carboxydovora]